MNTTIGNTPNPAFVNYNTTTGTQQTSGTGTTTGAGNAGAAGGQLPGVPASYTPPAPPPPLSDAELSALSESLSAAGLSTGRGNFDYDSVISTLANLMIQQSNDRRSQAMNQRTAGYEQAKAQSIQQAADMNQAADKMDKGAVLSMTIGIVTAGIAMIGSGISLYKQVGSLKQSADAANNMSKAQQELTAATKKADTFTDAGKFATDKVKTDVLNAEMKFKIASNEGAQIDKMLQRYQSAADLTSRGGDIGRQLGQGLDTKEQAQAKREEAEGSVAAAEATSHQQKAEIAKDVQQAMDDMIKQVINFVKEMQENKVEMMRAITR
ncbi:type III secretion system translocon subunit SctB [Aureimonas sp. AU4]|uniref:type III secretion system translocon subunit SctB n=1 Tax=Aureimonas sp. AU4 TaxID=1638163 RepID=UPI00078360B3|nr:type III secretion system translocon subunit SctB [Aureimonas sp. AU4]